ncbi:MAG: MarR family transcriptional regulator [Deltaproteobacteria bacterium]|nr:MarR family transcriptional regulator [Deltaproteobacteria bacterium]
MPSTAPLHWQKNASEFADALGTYMEVTGQPRLAGRMMGWLLVCDPPEQSALQLATSLGVSRSAVSAITQHATRMGVLERIAVPGKREIRFRIADRAWTQVARSNIPLLQNVRRAADRTLEALAAREPSKNHRLAEMRDMYAFIEREIPILLERWEHEHRRRG